MRCTILILLYWLSMDTVAQNWKVVGHGTIGPTSVQTLYGDTVTDQLLAGGTFMWIINENDTVLGMGQAAWNGHRWDSLAHRIQQISGNNSTDQTFWFLRFEGDLYACGGFGFFVEPNIGNTAFARLNESTMRWEGLECVNASTSGLSTLVPKAPQSTLYATGYSGSLCGYPQTNVFRYDGQAFYEWEPYALIPIDEGNYVGYIFDYRGKTYMTGLFRDPLSEGFVSFMRYNGNAWEHVPGWNTLGPIKEINIHNDTLYVAGAFHLSEGAPSDLVAFFDGESWNDMAGGLIYEPVPMSSAALDMEWIQGQLFVGGIFSDAAGVPVQGLAKWNGQQWCGLPGVFVTNTSLFARISDMAVWRDSLYICGGFDTIDGEPIRQVAQWIGGDAVTACSDPVGLRERPAARSFTLSPNPTGGPLHLNDPPPNAVSYRMTDALGRAVHSGPYLHSNWDTSPLVQGVYNLQLLDADGRVIGCGRFVRE